MNLSIIASLQKYRRAIFKKLLDTSMPPLSTEHLISAKKNPLLLFNLYYFRFSGTELTFAALSEKDCHEAEIDAEGQNSLQCTRQ